MVDVVENSANINQEDDSVTFDSSDIENEQSLWKQLFNARSTEDFAYSWLSLLLRRINNPKCGVLVLKESADAVFKPVALWPENKDQVQHLLNNAVELSIKEKRGVVQHVNKNSGNESSSSSNILAFPISYKKDIIGVVAIGVDTEDKAVISRAMYELQWSTVWIESLYRRSLQLSSIETPDELQQILQFISYSLESDKYISAANKVVTELSVYLDCDRVSMGLFKGKNIQVQTISHSSSFSKHSNLIRTLSLVMEEACDQATTIVYPELEDGVPVINKNHKDFMNRYELNSVCTVPFSSGEKIIGAMTFERKSNEVQFGEAEKLIIETAVQITGQVLELKQNEEKSIFLKIGRSISNVIQNLLGPEHIGFKLTAVILLLVITYFSTAMSDYRVTTDSKLEGAIQRVIVAPVSGYVADAYVKPGDIVIENDPIARMDDKDLKLEYIKWKAEEEKYLTQYREAVAKDKRAETNILKAQIGQAQAQLALLAEQLNRMELKAPFKGIVVSGDLSQSLGAPVDKGQILFEIAPLDDYRVMLTVDERDINQIEVGQKGNIILTGDVEESLPIEIESITPVSETKDGRNYFYVEARLLENYDYLKPGMEGVAKISVGERKTWWVLTHNLMDWIRLRLWYWQI